MIYYQLFGELPSRLVMSISMDLSVESLRQSINYSLTDDRHMKTPKLTSANLSRQVIYGAQFTGNLHLSKNGKGLGGAWAISRSNFVILLPHSYSTYASTEYSVWYCSMFLGYSGTTRIYSDISSHMTSGTIKCSVFS